MRVMRVVRVVTVRIHDVTGDMVMRIVRVVRVIYRKDARCFW